MKDYNEKTKDRFSKENWKYEAIGFGVVMFFLQLGIQYWFSDEVFKVTVFSVITLVVASGFAGWVYAYSLHLLFHRYKK